MTHRQGRLTARAVTIVEWRASGHRLAYVAAIARAGKLRGCSTALVTTPELVASNEFSVHLADEAVDVRLMPPLRSGPRFGFQLFRFVRSELRNHRACVVPEADRHLFAILAGRVVAGRRGRVAAVVMRPPFRNCGLVARVTGWVKSATMVLVRAARPLGCELLLLDDALPSPYPVWSWQLRWTGSVLRDPADLFLHRDPTQPKELDGLGDSHVISVLGSLDARKQVPHIVSVWPDVASRTSAALVLAGRVRTDLGNATAPRVHVLDRYLTDGELAWVLRRSTAVLVLYDGGLSSGIVGACAAAGVRVIAPRQSRLYRVAAAHGLGIAVDPSSSGLALGIIEACRLERLTPIETLPSRDDFGAMVLATACPRL